MKGQYRKFLLFGLSSILISLSGCNRIPTFEHWSKGLIGTRIEVLKEAAEREGSYASQIGWKDKSHALENGNWVYVFPVAPDCIVHAEVDHAGVIVGFRTDGQHCK